MSVDGAHIWIGDYCLTFEEAEAKVNEILGKIEFTRIWGNRNDRSKT